jgi:hypothetical protein
MIAMERLRANLRGKNMTDVLYLIEGALLTGYLDKKYNGENPVEPGIEIETSIPSSFWSKSPPKKEKYSSLKSWKRFKKDIRTG